LARKPNLAVALGSIGVGLGIVGIASLDPSPHERAIETTELPPRGTGLITGTARQGLERGMGKPLTEEERAERHEEMVSSPTFGEIEDYCLECLERHYLKAYGLLDEGLRLSRKEGRITPEARKRIREALKEIVTAEFDLGTVVRDPMVKKALDEINIEQRDIRKWMWRVGLTTTSEDLRLLEEATNKVKGLVEKVYKVAEIRGFECPICDELARKVCSTLEADKRYECYKAFVDLSSDDKDKARRAGETLKRLGVMDKALSEVGKVLSSMKGEGG